MESKSSKSLRILSWKENFSLFKETAIEYSKESTLMHSASLAYYALFAIIPIIYLGITLFGKILGNELVRSSIAHLLKEQVGITDISGIMEFLNTVDVEKGNVVLGTIGIIALLFSSSAFLISLKRSINDFYDLERPKLSRKKMLLQKLVFRLIAVVLVGAFGVFILTIYLSETVLISAGNNLFDNTVLRSIYVNGLSHIISIFTNFVIFTFIFKYVHDGIVKWKLAMSGAIITAILLYVGQLLIKYYLNNFFFAAEGGIAGTFFVLLAWVYYSAQIIFFGAKFIAVYANKAGRPIKLKFKTEEEIENSIL